MNAMHIVQQLINVEELFTFAFLFNIFCVVRNHIMCRLRMISKSQDYYKDKVNILSLLLILLLLFIFTGFRIYLLVDLFLLGKVQVLLFLVSLIEFILLLLILVLFVILKHFYDKDNNFGKACETILKLIINIIFVESMISIFRLFIF